MVLCSGKISKAFLCITYFTISILLITDIKINNFYIQLFQAKSFIDCDVDLDNSTHTCVSAYTLERSIKVPIQTIVASSFALASIFQFCLLVIHQSRDISIFKYLDNIIVNSINYFLICIIGGIQEVKFLILLITCVFCIELLYTYHDYNLDTAITSKLCFTLWIIQFCIWIIIFFSTGFYVLNSYPIPTFIPLYVYYGLAFILFIKVFHLRFYYYLIPKKIGYNQVETHETIKNSSPLYYDWLESWCNIAYLLQRCGLAAIYYYGSKEYHITYV